MDPTDVIDDLDFEKLIDVVRSHPAIWNTSHSDYSDKIKKENSWNDVCKSFFKENWENFSTNDKKTAVTDMKKKWGNLRDSYRKYKRKTKQSSGAGAKKIKKYMYADFLVFLDSTFEQRETDSNYSQEDNDNSISSVHSIIDIENSEKNIYSRKKKSKTNHEADDEAQSILDFIKLKSESEDEDYHFAMSLVPEIKRVPWQHKLNLKSEINLLISKYQQLSQSGPQSNNSGVPRYYQHRPLEHDDNFSQFIHQSQQLLHTSDYNQIPPNYRNSSQHHSQHFIGTQPSTSQLFQQEPQFNQSYTNATSGTMGHDHIIPQTPTDLLPQPNIQSSPQNLSSTLSTHTSTY